LCIRVAPVTVQRRPHGPMQRSAPSQGVSTRRERCQMVISATGRLIVRGPQLRILPGPSEGRMGCPARSPRDSPGGRVHVARAGRIRRLIPLAVVAVVAVSVIVAFGKTSPQRGGSPAPGVATSPGNPGSGLRRHHIRIVINARQTGGSWKDQLQLPRALTLDSISNAYPPLSPQVGARRDLRRRRRRRLKRAGASVYDAVTSHLGGEYDRSGTLRRVAT